MILLSAVSRYEKSKQTIIIALFFFAQSPLPERLEQAIQVIPPPHPLGGKLEVVGARKNGHARGRHSSLPTPLPLPLPHARSYL